MCNKNARKRGIKLKYLIIDERMRAIEKETLKKLGFGLKEIKQNKEIYTEISSHVDIFTCKIGNKLIVEPSQYDNLKIGEKGSEKIENKYPYDIKYNVFTIGKKAIHNFQYTDRKILETLKDQNYELINTVQGYTNCSIALIDENSVIVTDKGLFKILEKHGIDVLYITDELDIKLLNKDGYSNRKGFIGGAITRIDNKIVVFGDLNKIDKENKIRKFIESKGIEIIDFKDLDVIDYGGVVEINDN